MMRAVPGHCTMKTKLKCALTLEPQLKAKTRLINEVLFFY